MPPPAPPPIASPTLLARLWAGWDHITSVRRGVVGVVALFLAVVIAIAKGISAAETLSRIDWAAVREWASWAIVGVAGVLAKPWATAALAVVGVLLIWSVPAPKALPALPAATPKRPEEGLAVLQELHARGMAIAEELADYPGFRISHGGRLRQWSAEIGGAARRYLPPSHLAGLLELRSMNPSADNAYAYINLYLGRISEMIDELRHGDVG